AVFDFTVIGLPGWEVVSNSELAAPPEEKDGRVTWVFKTTLPMSTYVTCVCAGDWHVVRDKHRDIDLGLYCRKSLAEFMDPDELFEVTKQGLDFFEAAFGYPYPFPPKYDQIFVPESNHGAMENAACITFNDAYIFRSRVTDASRERRAETILHEMAHMWFGDLVTMRWWNDLWLNESFASYMAVLSQAEATRFKEAWTTFADTEKTWAYRQDQLPTTHPIVAEIPDVESIHLNFDGITYAKGASVLRQLAAWVGQDKFLEGTKLYIKEHEFGNAELADFLAALEQVSGRDLRAWSREWLETAGVNTIRPEFTTAGEGTGTVESFVLMQEAHPQWPTLRSHRLGIGLYDTADGALRLRRQVELDAVGERTDVSELVGETVPHLILLNDGDLTFAKIRLDQWSLRTAIERLGDLDDSLARALCWTSCWDMTRDGEMRARDYVELVSRNVRQETKIGLVQNLSAQAATAVWLYGDPANREGAGLALAEAALQRLREAKPGSDHQLAWARTFCSTARSPEHLEMVRGLLDGSVSIEGLTVDTELRWHIIRSLAAAGVAGEEEIEAELQRDPSDRGNRHAASARAARPSPEAKAEAWRVIVEDTAQPLALMDEVMAAFQQFGQEEVLEPYADRFFEALPGVWEARDLPEALAFGRRMYPHLIVREETVQQTDRYLEAAGVPAPVRRLLLEGKDGIRRAIKARGVDSRTPGG
ncbi:MAG TPA: aminopeptidase N, partial [Actinomycetota bacterium]|nr:aminopeptidase N [Actinomycetota bacterium]